MLNQSEGSQRLKVLSEKPTASDLRSLMEAASKDSGAKFYLGWTVNETDNYAISLEYDAAQTFDWHLFVSRDSEETRELWQVKTSDVATVRDRILETLGLKPTVLRATASASHVGQDSLTTAPQVTQLGQDSLTSAPQINPAVQMTPAVESFSAPIPRSPTTRTTVQELNLHTFTNIPVEDSMSALMPREEMLKGNLKVVHITNLVQSIGMGHMSGRLKIQRHPTTWADIYFVKGVPVHAEGSKGTGEDCFLQVVCWSDGDFNFEPKLKTDEKTINRSLEILLLEGVLLLDNTAYLMNAGIRMTSILEHVNADLSEDKFEEIMSRGEPIGMALLKQFYIELDGRETLEDIVTDLNLLRSQWVPVVANLLKQNVIALVSAQPAAHLDLQPKQIDSGLVDSVRRALLSGETGIFTYSALLFLLGVQIKCSTSPISMLIMEIQPTRATLARGKTVLNATEVQELANRVDKATSARNVLAHYDDRDFAVMLPGIRADKALRIAERIYKALATSPLDRKEATGGMFVSIGIACIPDDAVDVATLLGEAERAKQQASKSGTGICLARPSKSAP